MRLVHGKNLFWGYCICSSWDRPQFSLSYFMLFWHLLTLKGRDFSDKWPTWQRPYLTQYSSVLDDIYRKRNLIIFSNYWRNEWVSLSVWRNEWVSLSVWRNEWVSLSVWHNEWVSLAIHCAKPPFAGRSSSWCPRREGAGPPLLWGEGLVYRTMCFERRWPGVAWPLGGWGCLA